MSRSRKEILASPISIDQVAGALRLGDAKWDTVGETLVWLEGHDGVGVLVAQTRMDAPRQITGECNVRAEVGYGGGEFAVHGGEVYFTVKGSGQIFKQSLAGGNLSAITRDLGRSASMQVSPCGRWLLFVHHHQGDDSLKIVDTEGHHEPKMLASGFDFYMQPTWSPMGDSIAWVAWNHPQMPWDGTVLQYAILTLSPGELPKAQEPRILDGNADTSIFQPEFSASGEALYYICDRTGRGQLWRAILAEQKCEQITSSEHEYGQPAWLQDQRSYALNSQNDTAILARNAHGFMELAQVKLRGQFEEVVLKLDGYSDLGQLCKSPCNEAISLLASGPGLPPAVLHYSCQAKTFRTVRASSSPLAQENLSVPKAISYESVPSLMAHGIYYPPTTTQSHSQNGPPLLVIVHGGPTSQETARYNIQAQFFATRGFAVFLPNHRGSSGYGRVYQNALRGKWGVVDVEDVLAGVEYLVGRGMADPQRSSIMGASAGGYTVLQAMIHAPTVFAGGICAYGVTDLFGLLADTHKFEAHYPESLVGKLPADRKIYEARSPIFHADNIQRPLAIFQGDQDRVVPLAQAESIVQALRHNGVPYQYRVYPGEGHGFRKKSTISDFYSCVESFLRKHVLKEMNT